MPSWQRRDDLFQLQKQLGLKLQLLHAGIGWLTREGKLCFRQAGRGVRVSLSGN